MMERGDRMKVVIARLRTAPLVGWQLLCLTALALLLSRIEWTGGAANILRGLLFDQPLTAVMIAAVLAIWALWLGRWRRRGAYIWHDGQWLYRGGGTRWPLFSIRDVVITRNELGIETLRLVVDDDSEVTRELVKLYLLADRSDVVRDGVMFAAGRVHGFPTTSTPN